MAALEFFSQDVSFKLQGPRKTKRWIKEVISREKQNLIHLNFIFCTDAYLFSLNKEYLKHKTLTDIITFDNSEGTGIEGDVFISVERVYANARQFDVDPNDELHRVIVHGVLHLIGYADKSPEDKSTMRKKEDAYLSLRNKL